MSDKTREENIAVCGVNCLAHSAHLSGKIPVLAALRLNRNIREKTARAALKKNALGKKAYVGVLNVINSRALGKA